MNARETTQIANMEYIGQEHAVPSTEIKTDALALTIFNPSLLGE